MIRVIKFLFVLLILGLFSTSIAEPSGKILFSDSFKSLNQNWKAIGLDADAKGTFVIDSGKLKIQSEGNRFGVYHPSYISGHFTVEAEFTKDDNIGVALIQQKKWKA